MTKVDLDSTVASTNVGPLQKLVLSHTLPNDQGHIGPLSAYLRFMILVSVLSSVIFTSLPISGTILAKIDG